MNSNNYIKKTGDVFWVKHSYNDFRYYTIIKGSIELDQFDLLKTKRLYIQRMIWVKDSFYVEPFNDFRDRMYYDVTTYKKVIDPKEKPFLSKYYLDISNFALTSEELNKEIKILNGDDE